MAGRRHGSAGRLLLLADILSARRSRCRSAHPCAPRRARLAFRRSRCLLPCVGCCIDSRRVMHPCAPAASVPASVAAPIRGCSARPPTRCLRRCAGRCIARCTESGSCQRHAICKKAARLADRWALRPGPCSVPRGPRQREVTMMLRRWWTMGSVGLMSLFLSAVALAQQADPGGRRQDRTDGGSAAVLAVVWAAVGVFLLVVIARRIAAADRSSTPAGRAPESSGARSRRRSVRTEPSRASQRGRRERDGVAAPRW